MGLKAYKGFDRDMTCRGFQYEEGKTYETDKADLCASGFHACEYPLDCFIYYDPAHSVYHDVELDDVTKQMSDDSKRVGKRIKIGARLSIAGIVEASVNYIKEHLNPEEKQEQNDRRSAATNTGDRSAATNTGNRSAATNTGDCSAATNTGDCSAATNTGDYSVATNTGDYSVATNTGRRSAATNTGDFSAAEVTGMESIAIATGGNCRAKGALGCWLVLAEWKYDTDSDDDKDHIVDVQCRRVDGETIKADTWYMLKGGEFIEAESAG